MSDMTLKLTLAADGSGLRGELRDAQGQVRHFGGEVEKADKTTKGWDDRLKTGAASAVKLGAAAAAVAAGGMYALYRIMSNAAEAASVQEAAEAKLQAVLRATGEAAGYNLGQLKEMAGGMQAVTTVGDEVILNGMAMLGTFKEIRGEGFERATKAALDMSQLMGTDLNSSIMQIGKALNDPIANLSALSRAGVQFTDEQKEMITTLWEAGDTMGAQNIILAEMESQFGGVAEAARQTYGGMKQAAANAYGDMWEQLGTLVTQNSFFIEGMGLAEQQFVEWGNYIDENRDKLMELAKSGVLMVVDAIGGVVETISFFHQGWLYLKLAADGAIHAIALGLANVLYPALAGILKPLELVIEGLRRIGLVDTNPITEGLGRLKSTLDILVESTRDVGVETLQSIDAAKERYASWGGVVDTMRDKIAAIPATQREAGVQVDAEIERQVRTVQAGEEKKQQAAAHTSKENERLLKQQEKDQARAEQEKVRLVEQFNQDHRKLTTDRFTFERQEIEAQARVWEEAGADAVKVAEWRKLRLDEVAQAETEQFAREQGKQVQEAEKSAREILETKREAADSWGQYFQASLALELADYQTHHQRQLALYEDHWEALKTFADGGIKAIGDTFATMAHDIANGSFRSLEDYWKSLLSRMLSHAIDFALDVAAAWAKNLAVDFLSGTALGQALGMTGGGADGGGSGAGLLGIGGKIAGYAAYKLGMEDIAEVLGHSAETIAEAAVAAKDIGYSINTTREMHQALNDPNFSGAGWNQSGLSSLQVGAAAIGGFSSMLFGRDGDQAGAGAAASMMSLMGPLGTAFGGFIALAEMLGGSGPAPAAFTGTALTGLHGAGNWEHYAHEVEARWAGMTERMAQSTHDLSDTVVNIHRAGSHEVISVLDKQGREVVTMQAGAMENFKSLATGGERAISDTLAVFGMEIADNLGRLPDQARDAVSGLRLAWHETSEDMEGNARMTWRTMTDDQAAALSEFTGNWAQASHGMSDSANMMIASLANVPEKMADFGAEIMNLEAQMLASGDAINGAVAGVLAQAERGAMGTRDLAVSFEEVRTSMLNANQTINEAIAEIDRLEAAQLLSSEAAQEMRVQLVNAELAARGLTHGVMGSTDRINEFDQQLLRLAADVVGVDNVSAGLAGTLRALGADAGSSSSVLSSFSGVLSSEVAGSATQSMQALAGMAVSSGQVAEATRTAADRARDAARDVSGFGSALSGLRFPSVPRYAAGGWVPGAWNGMHGEAGDTIIAALTPGEAVIPRQQARRHANLVNAIMDDRVGYASSGVRAAGSAGGHWNDRALYEIAKHIKRLNRLHEQWQQEGLPGVRNASA